MQIRQNKIFILACLSFFPNRHKDKAGYIPSMYLQPYNHPHIRMTAHFQDRRVSSVLPLPSAKLGQSNELSRSQGNLQLLPARSPSPSQLQPESKQRSHSLDILSVQLNARPPPSTEGGGVSTTPVAAKHAPPPIIMVEMDGEEEQRGRSQRADSEASFVSNTSSEFSFSDDFSSSSASSSLNLSHSANNEQLRLSHTPPPTVGHHLSPLSNPEGKIIPSVSDPNLYKGPATPKVPPRPRTQEILTRCSTVTRRKATRGAPSPTQTEILSR